MNAYLLLMGVVSLQLTATLCLYPYVCVWAPGGKLQIMFSFYDVKCDYMRKLHLRHLLKNLHVIAIKRSSSQKTSNS